MASSSTDTLLCLPPEILTVILSQDVLEDVDVSRVSQVCKHLHDVCCDNEIWRTKLHQRYPSTVQTLRSQNVTTPKDRWLEFYKTRKKILNVVQETLSELGEVGYIQEVDKSHLKPLFGLEEEHELALWFVIDDLMDVLENSEPWKNLTHKYYGKKALNFIKHKLIGGEVQKFLQLPAHEQHLEIGACFIARWFQPEKTIRMCDITKQLDDIANQVRQCLRVQSPDHPACAKDNSLSGFMESLWSPEQCRKVLVSMNHVLYNQLGFSGNSTDYYKCHNSYFDLVLQHKTGIPITLCIVYSSVARRLGVLCEPVNFPVHFILRWKEHPMAAGDMDQHTYIDAFNRGEFLTPQQCVSKFIRTSFDAAATTFFSATTTSVVLERMTGNLVNIAQNFHGRTEEDHNQIFINGVEFTLIVNPNDIPSRVLYTRVCLYLNMNLRECLESMEKLLAEGSLTDDLRMQVESVLGNVRSAVEEGSPTLPDQKIRQNAPEVEFCVGMVMKHKRYNYLCVIFGWDKECTASKGWIQQMGVHRLSKKQYQPFYNVLVEDGSNRYAAQENLELPEYPAGYKEIPHKEVGKHFEEFTGTHYVSNTAKRREYPNDCDARATLLARHTAAR